MQHPRPHAQGGIFGDFKELCGGVVNQGKFHAVVLAAQQIGVGAQGVGRGDAIALVELDGDVGRQVKGLKLGQYLAHPLQLAVSLVELPRPRRGDALDLGQA